MSREKERLPARSSQGEIDAFLSRVAALPAAKPAGGRGRLMFAMDATASREPSWDQACHIQAQMFEETAVLGGLDIQLCYYRGHREFKASRWLNESRALLSHMQAVRCVGGITQIERVLAHAVDESRREQVDALVLVGDCMEEDVDRLCARAGELGLCAVPVFVFHEGFDPLAERAFRNIARLTRGAYCRFDASSAQQLRDLLSAVAVYAAGGRKALESFGRRRGGVVRQLSHQIGKS